MKLKRFHLAGGALSGKGRRVGLACRAFTLIEVVLSLGICAFALVSMIGLMAMGLTTMRQSMDYNTEAVIAQQLTGEAQMLDYSSVTNTASAYRSNFQKNRYFDVSGNELSNSPIPANYVYQVTLTVSACQLPGTSGTSPVAQKLWFQISNHGVVHSFNVWSVDNGR